jgi:aminoglycoside phosphotransferase (APT) family kinase protein
MLPNNLVDVRENHKFDLRKLNLWLRSSSSNFEKVISVKQFVGGQSNPTFVLFFENQENLILRKKPPGKLLPSAHAIEREYKVQKSLESSNVPCPKMIEICEDSSIIGTSFYIMSIIQGRVFESILDVQDKSGREIYYLELVRMLANLHNVDYSSINLEDFGKIGNYVNRQIIRWEKQWHLSKQRELPEMQKIIDWLNNNIPNNNETTIVHGDYRIGNIVCDNKVYKVNAVLDWELSTLGHPFADLGYFLYAHYIPFGERHGLNGADLNDLNIPTSKALVNEYCKIRNIKVFDPTFYVVLSLFRSISILEGVYARYVNGNESSPNAKDIGKDVEPLAKATFNIIKNL